MKRAFALLAVGDEAWCLFTSSSGEQRRTLDGAGRCRIVAIDGDVIRAEVTRAGKPQDVWIGRVRDFRRGDLYATKDRAEHLAFGTALTAFWPSQHVSQANRERALAMATGAEPPDEKFQLELWSAMALALENQHG